MAFFTEASKSRPQMPPFDRVSYVLGRRYLAIICLVAFASRALQFGNPVIQIDEEFYLLAGDRLLHGALPFVDIWDRKPFGLFAIFAAIRMLGGSGIVQYQVVATLFACATAVTIARISLRLTNEYGATIAGIVYLLFILSSGGDGGQAPVFYNLPVAIAALVVLKMQERRSLDIVAVAQGCLAMVLLGAAIQIKYTVVFEGMFLGVWMLWIARYHGARSAKIALMALLWCAIALIPTALICAFYWQRGLIEYLIFANFISIFQRSPQGLDIPGRIFTIAIHIALPAAIAIWGMTASVRDRLAHRFVGAWCVAAVMGVAVFGTYHYHYALPLFVPLAIAGAPIYGDATVRLRLKGFQPQIGHLAMLVGLLLAVGTMIGTRRSRGTGEAVYAAAQIVGVAPKGCIFVFNGDPILYHLTNSCLPNRFVFPTFLSETQDSVSLGRDPLTELRTTMEKKPDYIFTREMPPVQALPAAWILMKAALGKDYNLVFRGKAGTSVILGYRRKQL